MKSSRPGYVSGRPLTGTEKTLDYLTRSRLVDYQRENYVTNRTLFTERLAGAISRPDRAGARLGVCFVDLAPLRDPDLVTPTIAAVLGVQERAGRPLLAQVQDALRAQRLLLVLDNYEHLLPAAPVVADLMAAGKWTTYEQGQRPVWPDDDIVQIAESRLSTAKAQAG